MRDHHTLPRSAAIFGLTLTLFSASALAAESQTYRHHITVDVGDAEIIDADVSHLEPGASESFVTESGRMIDILRTQDGIELYIDGSLVESDGPGDALARKIELLEERIEGGCAEDEVNEGANEGATDGTDVCGDFSLALDGKDVNVFVMRRGIETVCDADGQCEESEWVGTMDELADFEDLEHDTALLIESLEHAGKAGGEHEVIVIREHIESH